VTVLERVRTVAPYAVGAALTASSVLHVTRPGFFRPMIPRWLGPPDPWVQGSAAVEAVVGLGLLTAQPWAGRAGAALLLAVWPGNLQMALDAGSGRYRGPADSKVVAWARLPLQLPLVWAALQSRPRRGRAG
jgi:uncharacterized membrane protein